MKKLLIFAVTVVACSLFLRKHFASHDGWQDVEAQDFDNDAFGAPEGLAIMQFGKRFRS